MLSRNSKAVKTTEENFQVKYRKEHMGDILSYNVNDDFIYKEIGNNYVAVDINTAKYYTFNDTAAFFIKCFADKKDQLQTKAAFFDEFDVNEETYVEGLNSFIKDAASKGILIPTDKEEI